MWVGENAINYVVSSNNYNYMEKLFRMDIALSTYISSEHCFVGVLYVYTTVALAQGVRKIFSVLTTFCRIYVAVKSFIA